MPKAEKVGAPKAEQKKTSLETPATSIPTESTTVETVSVARRGILPLFRRN